MKYRVVAIEREFASGGQEIGRRLAERLKVPCYGREILQMAADEMNIDLRSLEAIEEKAAGSLMYSMYLFSNFSGDRTLSGEGRLFVKESEIINRLTQTPAVVVGRCAVHSLADRSDVLRVFIRADREYRRKRSVETYEIPRERAEETLRRADRRRSGYYKTNTGKDWKDHENYHLILDSGAMGMDKCVEILEVCCK